MILWLSAGLALALVTGMRLPLVLLASALLCGQATANDLRDAKVMAQRLEAQPGKSAVVRQIKQRNGQVRGLILARRSGKQIEVETDNDRADGSATATIRTFEMNKGQAKRVSTTTFRPGE
jgi:hypothetical protein